MKLWFSARAGPVRSDRGLRFAVIGAATLLLGAGLSCAEPLTGPPAPPSAAILVLNVDSLGFEALGDASQLSGTLSRDGVPLVSALNWWVWPDSVAVVSQLGELVARRPGLAWLFATSDSGGRDSARVVVSQTAVRARVAPTGRTVMIGRALQFSASALDSRDEPLPAAPVTWTVSDGAVASVNAAGLVTGEAVGVTYVRGQVGAFVDSTALTVTPLPNIHILPDTILIGVGLFRDRVPALRVDSLAVEQTVAMTVTFDDTTIASAPALVHQTYLTTGPISLRGSSVGSTVMRISAANWAGDSAVVVVTPSVLRFGAARLTPYFLDEVVSVVVEAVDTAGVANPVAEPLALTVTSTNPSVVSAGSGFTLAPWPSFVRVEGGTNAVGEADLVVSAPGFLPDTVHVTVADLPNRISIGFFDGSNPDSIPLGVSHMAHGRIEVVPPMAPVVLTYEQRHPEFVHLDVFDPELGFIPNSEFFVYGLAAGVDTLIVTAPDYRSDTIILHVRPPVMTYEGIPVSLTTFSRFYVQPYFGTTGGGEGASGVAAAGIGSMEASSHDSVSGIRTLQITSSDPTVLVPLDSIRLFRPIEGIGSIPIRSLGVGTATLTFTEIGGLYPTVVSEPVTVTTRRLVHFARPPDTTRHYVGARQLLPASFDAPGGFLEPGYASHVTVNPAGHASVTPQTFLPKLVGYNHDLTITGGDTPGEGWVVASGPGLIPDSIRLVVSVPTTTVSVSRQVVYDGVTPLHNAVIQLHDGFGNLRATSEAVTFNLSSTDSTIIKVFPKTLTVPAGAAVSPQFLMVVHGAGNAGIRVEDPRVGTFRYTPQVTAIRVVPVGGALRAEVAAPPSISQP